MSKLNIILFLIALSLVTLFLGVYKSSQPAGPSGELTAQERIEVARQEKEVGVVSQIERIRYEHKNPDFSFEKPDGYVVGVTEQEGNKVIVVSNKTDSSAGFQVLISQLPGVAELTPSYIQAELPGIAMQDPKAIVLDGKGKGVMFSSNSEAFGGKSFEIWFIADGYVYQVSSYASFAAELQNIIGTWKF